MRHVIRALALLFVCQWASAQNLRDENLLQDMPPGYKIGFQAKRDNMIMMEFVPEQESVHNWTEMLTTQVFLGQTRASPSQVRQSMQLLWSYSCPGARFGDVAQGTENGYPFEVWIQDCPLSRRTGKPERVWLKAILGNDSLYMVQKAFRFEPEPEQVIRWTRYLASVRVCDTRLPDRSCGEPAR